MKFSRHFTSGGKDVLDTIEYELRDSIIQDPDGSIVAEVKGVEVPKFWSQLATDIVAGKYLRRAGVPGIGAEKSVKQLINRVARTITRFGWEWDYFDTDEDSEIFEQELKYILVYQFAAFNSPVWFNCGLFHEYGIEGSGGNWAWDLEKGGTYQVEKNYERPQCSACFIQDVQDDLGSIYDLAKSEAHVFKYGSGTGTNFSKLRSRFEKLSGGGYSSY